jgi:RNA polymerase sigma-70 factor, ECF subfamily
MAFDTAFRLLGNAADAEDATQEALLDAIELHTRHAIANWGGLLRQFATRRAIDRLRRRRQLHDLPLELPTPASDRPESAAIERELADRLRRAVAELPDREGSVFALRFFGEMSNPEIAETLGITADAVAVSLHKARAKLMHVLNVNPPRGSSHE